MTAIKSHLISFPGNGIIDNTERKDLPDLIVLGPPALIGSGLSILGIYMSTDVFFDIFSRHHSSLGPLLISAFFGLILWYFNYQLFKVKRNKKGSTENKKLKLTLIIKICLFIAALAAGVDAGAALFQKALGAFSSSSFMAIVLLTLGSLSLFCRAAKYYISDSGEQVSEPHNLFGVGCYTKDNCFATTILQGAVFELFPFGESVAHLLAAYIFYSNVIIPYFLVSQPHILPMALSIIGLTIGIFAFFAQYVIICATDLNWAARTLDVKNGGSSEKIDNRFRLIGQLLLYPISLIYRSFFCRMSIETASKLLKGQIICSKVLGQVLFAIAGLFLALSLLCPTANVSGIPIGKIVISSNIFVPIFISVGVVLGLILGWRDFVTKNANHEIDRFIGKFLSCATGKAFSSLPNPIKQAEPIWAEKVIGKNAEGCCSNICNTKNFLVILISSIFGAGIGGGYAASAHTNIYEFSLIGAGTFLAIALLFIVAGKKDFLDKGIVDSVNNNNTAKVNLLNVNELK